MSAHVGDRIRQHANTPGGVDRVLTVIEVLGDDGPPYRVRHEDGSETVVTPGPDAVIEPGSWSERASAIGDEAATKVNQKASELYGTARERSGEAYDRTREKTAEYYDSAREKSAEYIADAKERGTEAYESAKERSTDVAGKAARAVAEAADKVAKRFQR